MIALAGARRRLHLAQKRVHLLGLQRPPRAHRVMAGESRKPLVEPPRQRLGAVFGRKIGGEIAHEPGKIALSDRRGRFAHHDRPGAEALDDKAEAGEFLRMRVDQRGGLGIEIHHHRGQQRLPFDCAPIALKLETLVDDAFMRGVLVDDDNAVARLGDDVIFVHLRPRRAKRSGEIALVGQGRRRGR